MGHPVVQKISWVKVEIPYANIFSASAQDIFCTWVRIENLSISSDSMTLILFYSRDVEGVAFLAESDLWPKFNQAIAAKVSSHNSYIFAIPVKRPFQKYTLLPSLIYVCQVLAKSAKTCRDTQNLAVSKDSHPRLLRQYGIFVRAVTVALKKKTC